ncbi:MAG: tRNA lysidine(34) synthetase TilS [Gemmatimonadales bacterium]
MPLLEAFRRHLAELKLPAGRALVAVSGGPDSLALLDLLVHSRDVHRLDLVVAHADHGIHADSAGVAEQVRALATGYGLPVEIGRLALGPGTSETIARAERYAWLEETRTRLEAGLVLTAHHADDQVETVLMRVLEGSGPAGLSAMSPVSGRLVRPLLPFSRAELVRHLEDTGLHPWDDPANRDPRHLRSWIRTGLLPALRKRLPEVDAKLLQVSRHAARDRAAWDSVLEALPDLDLRVESDGISVAAHPLRGYDSPLAQAVILAAARRTGCRPGPARVGRVIDLLNSGSSGSRVPLGGTWSAEMAFGRLRICSDTESSEPVPWQLQGKAGQGVWGRWVLRWGPDIAPGRQDRTAMSAWFTSGSLTVRGWSPGEKVKPLGRAGRRLIVRCFQELEVPRSRRGSWPVLARDEEIVWIPGVCRSDALLPAEGTEALRIDAEYA